MLSHAQASALVVMALGRIELEVKEYEEFIAILKDIEGMGQIVGILTGITLLHNICICIIISNYYTVKNGSILESIV